MGGSVVVVVRGAAFLARAERWDEKERWVMVGFDVSGASRRASLVCYFLEMRTVRHQIVVKLVRFEATLLKHKFRRSGLSDSSIQLRDQSSLQWVEFGNRFRLKFGSEAIVVGKFFSCLFFFKGLLIDEK